VTFTPSRRFAIATVSLSFIVIFFYVGAPHVPYVIIHGALLRKRLVLAGCTWVCSGVTMLYV